MRKSASINPGETLDALFQGRLRILQRRDGYRFSIDALLLAHFSAPRPKDRIIDLGCGCGIISLVLIHRKQAEKVTALEIQPSLADLARRNAALNRVSSRMQVREEDLRTWEGRRKKEGFDLALCNPPYRRVGSGRVNPCQEKALARHEINATLGDVLRAAQDLLKAGGRLALIYPASRTIDLIEGMRKFRLEPKRLQFVHSYRDGEARLLLVEGVKEGRAQIQVLPPLFLFDAAGKYTPQAEEIFL